MNYGEPSEDCDRALIVRWAKLVREALIDCSERTPSGEFYATDAGVLKLQRVLERLGIEAEVSIAEDGKFEVRLPV